MQRVGQGLAVGGQHLVADVGQADGADQERVEVVLLIDDGVGQAGRVAARCSTGPARRRRRRRRPSAGPAVRDPGWADSAPESQGSDRSRSGCARTGRRVRGMPLAIAPSVAFSLAGSIESSTAVSRSNTVLISTVTWPASRTAPGATACGAGLAGTTNSTNFAPNTVVEVMLTTTLAGICCSASRLIARCKTAWPLDCCSMEATLPTCTPSSSTLASGFITRPARCDNTVSGTVSCRPPRNNTTATATMAAVVATVTTPVSTRIALFTAANPTRIRPFAELSRGRWTERTPRSEGRQCYRCRSDKIGQTVRSCRPAHLGHGAIVTDAVTLVRSFVKHVIRPLGSRGQTEHCVLPHAA